MFGKQVHQLICDEPWFSFIKSGIKPVEGRKNSPKYQGIQVGDVIEFTNENGESFKAKIVEIRKYPSLVAYLEDTTIEKALPGVASLDDAIKIYHQWSTHEEIELHGFLGIFVEPMHEYIK